MSISSSGTTSERTVFCSKFQKELPGLAKPPFSGDLGKSIFERVSQQAWKMWNDDMMIKVINEYRLNMADPEQYAVLVNQMRAFLKLDEGEVLEVENAERGKAQS